MAPVSEPNFTDGTIEIETFQLGSRSVPRIFGGLWQMSSPAWGTAPRSKIIKQFKQQFSIGLTAFGEFLGKPNPKYLKLILKLRHGRSLRRCRGNIWEVSIITVQPRWYILCNKMVCFRTYDGNKRGGNRQYCSKSQTHHWSWLATIPLARCRPNLHLIFRLTHAYANRMNSTTTSNTSRRWSSLQQIVEPKQLVCATLTLKERSRSWKLE
jgi:hypothetical protein